MAAVKTIGGSVVDVFGVPLPSKTVTLKNDDTGAPLTTTTTNADGEWEFANRDETIRYRAEAAVGGSSSQVVVRKPASAEFDHLYANLSFRTAAAATVALGGALTVAGATALNGGVAVTGTSVLNGAVAAASLTVTGASNLNGGLGVTGASTLNGTVAVGSTLTVTGASNLNGGVAVTGTSVLNGAVAVGGALTLPVGSVGAPSLTFVGDSNSGLAQVGDGMVAIVANGTARATVNTTGLDVNGVLFAGATTLSGVLTAQAGIAVPTGDVSITNNLTVAGVLTIPTGSVGTASPRYAGDSDTGPYLQSADNYRIQAGGTDCAVFAKIGGFGYFSVPGRFVLTPDGSSAATPANVSGRYPLYNAGGAIVGYIPIYATL